LKPYFDLDKIKNKNNLEEKEMYFLIENKEEDIRNFLDNINYLKENLKFLEMNPITDANKKIEMLKPLEEKSIGLDSNLMKININIDTLLKNYSETCDVLNRKFAIYDKLLKKLENK
jgi:hypothetical protein